MLKLVFNWFLVGCVIGTVAGLMTGCSYVPSTVKTYPTSISIDTPFISDFTSNVGPSYACDTRKVMVVNPTEQTIAVAVDCRCKDPKDISIEPHTRAVFYMAADKSLNGPNQCLLAWAIAGQSAPIVSRLRGQGF